MPQCNRTRIDLGVKNRNGEGMDEIERQSWRKETANLAMDGVSVLTFADLPCGFLEIVMGSHGVERITHVRTQKPLELTNQHHTLSCHRALRDYFLHGMKQPTCALNPLGTPFQLSVWHALSEIPYGETRSYQDIANRIGRSKAVRAVANAIAKNPILVLIPCHRVIRKDGKVGGFSAGIEFKRMLLEHERTFLARESFGSS